MVKDSSKEFEKRKSILKQCSKEFKLFSFISTVACGYLMLNVGFNKYKNVFG